MANVVAFHTGALVQYPTAEAIRRIAAAGQGGVELNAETLPWAAPHVSPALSTAEGRAIRQAAADAEVAITSLSAHISLGDAELRASRAPWPSTGGADLVLDLGTKVIHGLTGVLPAAVPRSEAWGWACEAVDEMARLMADLPGVPVGVKYDPSHLVMRSDDPAEAAPRFGERITAVHLKDGRGTAARFEFPPLGQGAVDFAALAAALREVGYAGALAVEYEAHVFGDDRLSEAEVLGGSLAVARRGFQ